MHDIRFEDLLRETLRDEARALPMTVSLDVVQRRLAERRSRARARTVRLLLVAATVAILAGAAVVVGSRLPRVEPVPPDATVTLPAAADLLTGFADATVRLERSVGPADAPIDPASSTAPGASPAPMEIGRVKLTGPFVIGVACLGHGEIRVEVRTPQFDFPYTQAVAPCDGKPVSSEYLAAPIDPNAEADIVSVIVDQGASWRVAFGEYPPELATPPAFEPIELTPGWALVSNDGPVLLSAASPKTGARASMPVDATRAGVFVQCQGDGSVTVSAGTSATSKLDCQSIPATRRFEYPVSGGEAVEINVVGGGSRTWVRLIVETDATTATTYPSAPSLPNGVASVPYVVPDNNVLAFGTIGSNRQLILPVQGTRPGMPAGDLVSVAVFNETGGPHVDLSLVSVSSGAILRDLASVDAPSIIFDSWVDATHDAVFYVVGQESGIDFHRVATDGSDDQVVATIDSDPTGFTADLALDDSVFVIDSCHAGAGCRRTVVDAATAESVVTEREGDPICKIFGIVDGTIVGSRRPVCTQDAQTDVVAVSLVDGSSTLLAADVVRSTLEGAFVVDTDEGAKFVLGGPVGSVEADGMAWDVLDITTRSTSRIDVTARDGSPLFTAEIRLPGGWILLTRGGLGDFPWQRAADRPVPVMVNLVTDQRIELVNLPHWTGNLLN
jgi:hypothetical protein